MQGALVALQRQHIVATLIDDLLSDGALAGHHISGYDSALQRQQLQQFVSSSQ